LPLSLVEAMDEDPLIQDSPNHTTDPQHPEGAWVKRVEVYACAGVAVRTRPRAAAPTAATFRVRNFIFPQFRIAEIVFNSR